MPKGSAIRAELNKLFKTVCAHCGTSISTETGHYLTEKEYQTRGLVGMRNGKKMIFPTCVDCYEAGWRPPEFVFMN